MPPRRHRIAPAGRLARAASGALVASAALAALAAATGCGAGSPAGGGAPGGPPQGPPEVRVAEPVERVVPEWEIYNGRLTAPDRVEVRPRVTGFVERVHFEEGSLVRRGAPLYSLDPRTFRAAQAAAEARVDAIVAQLANARRELERSEGLIASRAVSQEELDQRRREVETRTAALAEARAELEAATLDLEFTRVVAPIDGRVGRAEVTEGNLVTGGSGMATVLTTIVSVDPIWVYFPLDERSALRLLERGRLGAEPVRVELQLTGERGWPRSGRLDFVDNAIDEATGTLLVRAVFDNPDAALLPGAFGRVRLQSRAPQTRLLVPQKALGVDQTQEILLVVGADDVVERRVVETGDVRDGWIVVREGSRPASA